MITLAEIGDPLGLKRLLEHSHAAEDREFQGGTRGRKTAFAQRLLIDHERHRQLVLGRIAAVYETAVTKESISRHVDHRQNLLKKMADRVAIAYDVPPARELKGVEEGKQRAFLAAYKEAETNLHATCWGRDAWLCNVVHVLPRVELGRLTWVTVRPHAADVIYDPRGEAKPSILIYETRSRGARYVAVDGERWWWIDERWELVPGGDEPHAMGQRPWAEFRCAAPPEDDYWDRGRGQILVDATLEIGRLSAHLGWARKIHSKNAAYIIVGAEDDLPPGQTLNGEDMLFARGDGIRVGTLDMIVPVKDFEDEIAQISRDVAEAIGVPYSEASRSQELDQAQLSKVRDGHIKWLRVGEEQAARSAAAELVRTGHPGAVDPGTVGTAFNVDYAPLTYAESPKARVETAQAEMSVGRTSEFRFYQREHQVTLEQAREAVMQNLADRAEFMQVVTTRNLPLNAENDGASIPELQGQIGGRTAAMNEEIQSE